MDSWDCLSKPQCSKSKLYNPSIVSLSIPPNQGAKFKAKGNASNKSGTKVDPLCGVDIVVTLLIQPACALESRNEASSGIEFFNKLLTFLQ